MASGGSTETFTKRFPVQEVTAPASSPTPEPSPEAIDQAKLLDYLRNGPSKEMIAAAREDQLSEIPHVPSPVPAKSKRPRIRRTKPSQVTPELVDYIATGTPNMPPVLWEKITTEVADETKPKKYSPLPAVEVSSIEEMVAWWKKDAKQAQRRKRKAENVTVQGSQERKLPPSLAKKPGWTIRAAMLQARKAECRAVLDHLGHNPCPHLRPRGPGVKYKQWCNYLAELLTHAPGFKLPTDPHAR